MKLHIKYLDKLSRLEMTCLLFFNEAYLRLLIFFNFILMISVISCYYSCGKESDTAKNESPQTLIEVNTTNFKCENIYTNEVYHAIFQLKNVGENPFCIYQVSTSCGCIFTEWNRDAVSVGKMSEIDVEMKWNEKGDFKESINVYCNVDKSPITLTVSGSVKDGTIN